MKIIWNSVEKKCNLTDSSFEKIVENSDVALTQDDKDFIMTSFNAGMYNYVVEYVFNKTTKALQDAVFAVGEDIVLGITHWIDKIFISKFFDVFILRLACDFDLISRQEKIKLLQVIELLQYRRDNQNFKEIDKEKAKYMIVNCFESVLFKDYGPFMSSIKDTVEALYTIDIQPYSEIYNDIVEATNKHKNLLLRIIFAMLRNSKEEGKRLKTLIQNFKNIFPYLWDNANPNDKKFISYYIKASTPDSVVAKAFADIADQIKLPDFTTDVGIVTKILKNCQDVLSSHYSVNNHKGEILPLSQIAEIEHYPNLFLRSVMTPAIITYLGNNYGQLSESRQTAENILNSLSGEKWTYYFKNFFYKDDFALINLISVSGCLKDWCGLIKKSGVDEDDVPNENIRELIVASKRQDFTKLVEFANKIYYS